MAKRKSKVNEPTDHPKDLFRIVLKNGHTEVWERSMLDWARKNRRAPDGTKFDNALRSVPELIDRYNPELDGVEEESETNE